LADRVTAVAQNFFEPLPTGGDLYLLMKVLNDWPDKGCPGDLAMLRRRRGRTVGSVMGGVAQDEAPRGLVIEMVLVGGTSRGMERFTALADQAAGRGRIWSAAEWGFRGRAEAAPPVSAS
jgi:hypothetical protein